MKTSTKVLRVGMPLQSWAQLQRVKESRYEVDKMGQIHNSPQQFFNDSKECAKV